VRRKRKARQTEQNGIRPEDERTRYASWQLVSNLVVFLHSTSVASGKGCQPVKIVINLIDLSRHVVIDLSGCKPTKK